MIAGGGLTKSNDVELLAWFRIYNINTTHPTYTTYNASQRYMLQRDKFYDESQQCTSL